MHIHVYLALAMTLPAADSDDAVKKEKKLLAGGWVVVTAQRDGEALPEDEVKKLRLSFGEDRMVLKQGEKTSQMQYRIVEPNSKPHALEMIPNDGPQKDKPMPAIYDVTGDNLKICLALKPDAGRPGGFSTTEGSGLC
jgi:uncharacterized protein (TIGR03067 family)